MTIKQQLDWMKTQVNDNGDVVSWVFGKVIVHHYMHNNRRGWKFNGIVLAQSAILGFIEPNK